jgi:PKD repeat protein
MAPSVRSRSPSSARITPSGIVAILLVCGLGATSLAVPHVAGLPPRPSISGTSAALRPTPSDAGRLAPSSRAAGPALPAADPISPGGYLWTNLSSSLPISPSARITAIAWDPSDGYVLLFGGEFAAGGHSADTWAFGNGSWTNLTSQVTGSPPLLAYPSLAYDPSSAEVILWGAVYPAEVTSVTWGYHDKVWTNLTGTVGTEPSPRSNEMFAYDSTDGKLILYGGRPYGGSGGLYDTWSFNSGRWANLTATAGWAFGGVGTPTGADDPSDHGLMMYGFNLLNSTTAIASTYVFSGGNWRNLSASILVSPAPSADPRAGYLPSLNSIVLYQPDAITKSGGIAFHPTTYSYSGGSWTNLTLEVAGPPGLGQLTAATVIGSTDSFLSFGGFEDSGAYGSSTWVLSSAPALTASTSSSIVDAGGSVRLSTNVSGGVAPYAYRWNFGDGSNGSSPAPSHTYATPGLHTATVTITDLAGRSASASVAIYVNPALGVAAAVLSTPTTVGTTVGFFAQVSGGTAPYTYHWSLGDGSTESSASVSHAYTQSGNYTVTLNVTDAVGVGSTSSTTVEVNKAPAAPSTGSSGGSGISLTSGTGLYLLLGIILLAVVVGALAALLARRSKPPNASAPAYPVTGGAPPAATGNYSPTPPGAG